LYGTQFELYDATNEKLEVPGTAAVTVAMATVVVDTTLVVAVVVVRIVSVTNDWIG
jgi:hypothetical protein